VRPYTMIQFIALAAAIFLISIEKRGWSWPKVIGLGFTVLLLALTHYFSVGLIGAFAVYSLIRFRGRKRLAVFSAVVVGAAIALVAWRSHLGDYSVSNYGRIPDRSLLHLCIERPAAAHAGVQRESLIVDRQWIVVARDLDERDGLFGSAGHAEAAAIFAVMVAVDCLRDRVGFPDRSRASFDAVDGHAIRGSGRTGVLCDFGSSASGADW